MSSTSSPSPSPLSTPILPLSSLPSHFSSLQKQYFPLSAIGTSTWLSHHDIINRLNMEAHRLASLATDEEAFIDAVVTHNYVPPCYSSTSSSFPTLPSILLHDILSIYSFQHQILPPLSTSLLSCHSLRLYIILYHKTICWNLLEILMWHKNVIRSMGEQIIEVGRYCVLEVANTMQMLLEKDNNKNSDTDTDKGKVEEEEKQNHNKNDNKNDHSPLPSSTISSHLHSTSFPSSISSLHILRSLLQTLDDPYSPVGLSNEILLKSDLLMILIDVIHCKPWRREREKDKGKGKVTEVYQDFKWTAVSMEYRDVLTPTDASVWISIYQCLFSKEAMKYYKITPYRKNKILSLKPLLLYRDKIVIQQMKEIGEILRYVENLSLMVVNDEDQMRGEGEIMRMNHVNILYNMENYVKNQINTDDKLKDMVNIYQNFHTNISSPFYLHNSENTHNDYLLLSSTYDFDLLSSVLYSIPSCSNCGKEAKKRCSQCKSEWYCGRDCQVERWKIHEGMCKEMKKWREEKEREREKKDTAEREMKKKEEGEEEKVREERRIGRGIGVGLFKEKAKATDKESVEELGKTLSSKIEVIE